MSEFLLELRCEEIPARMQAGARADFLVLDTTASGLAGLPDAALLDGLVFASQGPAWREVYVAGQPRPIDDAHRRERFQATMAALWR